MTNPNNLLMYEAAELRDQFKQLQSFIYVNDAIKNSDDFLKLKLLCENSIIVVTPHGNDITLAALKKHHKLLPGKIQELENLNDKIKNLITRVKNQLHNFINVGIVSQGMQQLLSTRDVELLLRDAKDILKNGSNIELKSNLLEQKKVSYKMMDQAIMECQKAFNIQNGRFTSFR